MEETRWLPLVAERRGAIAASAFGAGFGGSCWALVKTVEAAEFAGLWAADYRHKFPEAGERATFFVMRPGPGARQVEKRRGE